MSSFSSRVRTVVAALVVVLLAGCQTVQYQALEAVGIEKRGILEARVEAASEAQDETGEQFETTLERFRSVVEFDGGDLERAYRRLNREYERSVDRAGEVSASRRSSASPRICSRNGSRSSRPIPAPICARAAETCWSKREPATPA